MENYGKILTEDEYNKKLLCNCAKCDSPVLDQHAEFMFSYCCSNMKCDMGCKPLESDSEAKIAWYYLNKGYKEGKG